MFQEIYRPIHNSKEELTNTLTKINKIFTESLNTIKLKELINDKNKTKDKSSIKILELFLADVLKTDQLDEIIKPFYILDDFRIVGTHAGVDKKFDYCLERLDLKKETDYTKVYYKMLQSLKKSLELLFLVISVFLPHYYYERFSRL